MQKKIFDWASIGGVRFFSFRVVLGLRGKIVPLQYWPNQKVFFAKSYYFDITNNEIVQNSKSKPKKFSFLCTFKEKSDQNRIHTENKITQECIRSKRDFENKQRD